jgi:nucleoside-diphosphate-sugar epimerase
MDTSAPATVEELEDRLSEPTERLIASFGRLQGDIIVLGVAGKMGPSLARMARRASNAAGTPRRIIGVARFTAPGCEADLHRHGVETIRCDLLDSAQLASLPDAPNIIYLAGRKFGSTGDEPLTWAVNTFLPGLVCSKFAQSRIIALSTGNVYGLTRVSCPSRETDSLNPQGEYAMSCVGRERIFEHFSRALNIPTLLIRLNYAAEMRYGVLVDIAQRVVEEEPVDLAMGYLNVIWQADACAMTLQALEHASVPARVVNVTGPEVLSVRELAEEFGRLLGKPVSFRGVESAEALLSDSAVAHELFGPPRIDAAQLVSWTADWIRRRGPTLGKPTHFEVRDGRF